MKKLLALLTMIPSLVLVAPPSAHAVVNSINGQSALNQLLTTPGSNAQNSMHMEIFQQGNDTNRFRWDGSPWRVDQGGTGLTLAPQLGQILVGNGSGYSLVETSTLGLVPYVGATSDVDVGEFRVAANGFKSMTEGINIYNNDGVNYYSDSGTTQTGNIYSPEPGWYYLTNLTQGTPNVRLNVSPVIEQDKSFTFPNYSGTLGLLEAEQTWSGINIFSKGASATTTVTFGELGDSSSTACFNTKNIAGDNISFYFVGTTMVVENNVCQ